jgi:hypothetical protein
VGENPDDLGIRTAKGVMESLSQDGAVLVDVEQGLCFRLNPVGAKIWQMVKDGRSVDEIADAFEREFGVPRPQLLGDISAFLRQLERMRLIGERSSLAVKGGLLRRLFNRRRDSSA